MLLTFEGFQRTKKIIYERDEALAFGEGQGDLSLPEDADNLIAYLVYEGDCYIRQEKSEYVLLIERSEYRVSLQGDLKSLERHLYHWYCCESVQDTGDLKIMGAAVVDFEWGTVAQINMENSFVRIAKRLGFLEDDAWVSFSLKATTEEMVQYAIESLEKAKMSEK